ncbi:MAG: hypothetical protein ACLQQ4_15245, partial [Bacteroidia bacterium]
MATSGVAPLSTAIPAPGSAGTGTFPVSNLHSLHVFRDNSFMVVGSSGAIYYYNPVASSQWNDESPTAVASYGTYTWMDIDARDDRTMWVAGNNPSVGGAIIKVIDPVNIQPNIPLTYSVTPIGSSWALEPIADGPTANNIVTTANQVVINAIAFSGPYSGVLGGTYTGTNTSGYPYARLLSDMGGVYSTLSWYDRIGRLTISQNTKQHNYQRPAYSYTLFDALGRIIEVGQKTENTDAITFNTVFGDTIMSFYNPNVISPSKFLAWIKDNTGPRTEVTHTYFDVQDILPITILAQQELRNRAASAIYSDTLRTDSTKFRDATYYSYDIHGNVATLIQDDTIQGVNGQRFKRVDYQYDLISNNVNEVDYQLGQLDQYHQRYEYDADNRLTLACTSRDSILWDNDAKYFYYAHLPLARVEIGDQQVQGIDYAYTLQGWVKGVNSDLLDSNRDMGHDGLLTTENLNKYFARDAAGYTLKYYRGEVSTGMLGDYDAINKTVWNNNVSRFEAYDYKSDLMNARHDLFSGMISASVKTIMKPTRYATLDTNHPEVLPQGAAYNYDQLDRLIDMKAYQNLDTDNIWGLGTTYMGLYHNWLTYDENGNILTQKRADQNGNVFDSLTYKYNVEGNRTLQNRLYHVNDAITSVIDGITNDIKDEGVFDTAEGTMDQKNNYRYNLIGQLAKDTVNGIDTIIWTNYGKLWKIKKYNGDSLIYGYDPLQNRVFKEFKPASALPQYTYYIHDAQGHILTMYDESNDVVHHTTTFKLTEREVYGSSRLGTDTTSIVLMGSMPMSQVDTFSRYLGNKHYEIDDHLGTPLAIVSDRKIPRPNASGTQVDHYEADVASSNDYYPFGMLEPGRSFSAQVYKFGYNKSLKDDEIYGVGNSYSTTFRELDPRLGKWWTIDPKVTNYPGSSPYLTMGDNPIGNSDIDGDGPGDPPKADGGVQARVTFTFGSKQGSHLDLGLAIGGSVKDKVAQVGLNFAANCYTGGLGTPAGATSPPQGDLIISPTLTIGGGVPTSTAAPLNTFNSTSLTGVTNNFQNSFTAGRDYVFNVGGAGGPRNQIEGVLGAKAGDFSFEIYNDTKMMGGGGTDAWWTGGGSVTITNFLGNGHNTLSFGTDVYTGNSYNYATKYDTKPVPGTTNQKYAGQSQFDPVSMPGFNESLNMGRTFISLTT